MLMFDMLSTNVIFKNNIFHSADSLNSICQTYTFRCAVTKMYHTGRVFKQNFASINVKGKDIINNKNGGSYKILEHNLPLGEYKINIFICYHEYIMAYLV